MRVENGRYIVEKGSLCCPIKGNGWTSTKIIDISREKCRIESNIMQEDVEFNSPSMAASMITWTPEDGWEVWKTEDGQPIDIYRDK